MAFVRLHYFHSSMSQPNIFGCDFSDKIMRDPETGNSWGFGFISYDSFEASDAAIELLRSELLGQSARLVLLMDFRFCLCLFILGSSWCCTARELAAQNILVTNSQVLRINNLQELVQPLEEVNGNEQLCTLCEEYTAKALNYIEKNKTETEIIELLHKSCSKMPYYKQECVVLVDYYAPLFFLEINKIKPEDFCQKVDLCEQVVSISQVLSGKSCDLCREVVAEAKSKLKDPDTQLELLELFLKACGAVKGYAKKCKKLVFEYAPVILVNAEQFLEKNDVCAILHACEPAVDKEQPSKMQTSLHSAS